MPLANISTSVRVIRSAEAAASRPEAGQAFLANELLAL
jgi:hypothetical protein